MEIYKILSGAVDAKTEVLNMLRQMPPAQRQAARNMLPKVQQLAGQFGYSSDNFINEVNAHLQ